MADQVSAADQQRAVEVAQAEWQEWNKGMESDGCAELIVTALAAAGLLSTSIPAGERDAEIERLRDDNRIYREQFNGAHRRIKELEGSSDIAWSERAKLQGRIDAALALIGEFVVGARGDDWLRLAKIRRALSGPVPEAPLSDFPLQEFLEEEGPLVQPPSRSTSRRSSMKPVRLSGPIPTTEGEGKRALAQAEQEADNSRCGCHGPECPGPQSDDTEGEA